jgi:nuclear RNA export factor
VNPRTRIDGDEGSQQHYDNFQRGNQRFPHRGRGKKRFSPYERQQYQGGQEDEFFEDVVGEEDETQPKGDIFSRLGNREEGSTFQDPLDDGYTEGQGADSWFKVTVPGAADDTDEWMSRIRSEIGIPLEEHNLHVLGNKMMFFVNDSNVASALRGIDGKIQSQSGPLRVRVNPSNPPQPPRGGRSRGTSNFQRGSPPFRGGTPRLSSGGFDGEITMKDVSSMRDTLKQSLGTRYVPAEKSLNLSDMFNDATASSSGMKVIMTKANFVEVIIQLIAEFCPDLVTLNLSSNRIQYLSMYSELSKAAPNLQAVDLSKNNIRHLNELDHIAGCMQLKYLQLEGNPGVDHFRDFSSLAQDVRRRFPNLQNLNGQEMAKPVKFGVPDSSSLPPPLPPVQGNYVISEEVQTVVTQFVKAYYEIYDSANRDNLLSAYHDTAFFSLSVRQTDRSGGGPVGHPVNSYLPVSRNFLRLPDAAKRNALIQGGRVDIVKALKSLPRTFHILSSFTVDVLTASSTLTCFTLIGAFAEVSSSSSVLSEYDVRNVPMRCFSRTFAVIPIPNG